MQQTKENARKTNIIKAQSYAFFHSYTEIKQYPCAATCIVTSLSPNKKIRHLNFKDRSYLCMPKYSTFFNFNL